MVDKIVKYPVGCESNLERFEFLTSLREKLRLLYNAMSSWAFSGIDVSEYNDFPKTIKEKYPYIAKLSSADFTKFVKEEFELAERPIHQDINDARAQYIAELKGQFLTSTTWNPDLEEQILGP